MKVLLINKYFFSKGGSETCFFDTARILSNNGHEVFFFSMQHPSNSPSTETEFFTSHIDYNNPGAWHKKFKSAARLVYSREARHKLESLLRSKRPDIVHLHNIHHQISPSILHTLKKHQLPIVMTLHDYKMICPAYTMFNQGKVCEKCRQQKFFFCVKDRCNNKSYARSFLNYLEMVCHHKLLKIYDHVDLFISPSLFLQGKLAEFNFPGRVLHLPNPVDPSLFAPSYSWRSESLLYAGRLTAEKGVLTLLQAIKGLKVNCNICGEGPLKKELERFISQENIPNVVMHGHIPKDALRSLMADTMFVVVPSVWRENFPYAVTEAFAAGKPVIASRIGGIPELVMEQKTGLTFPPGDAAELRNKILYLMSDPAKINYLGKKARIFVEQNLDQSKYYTRLLEIYNQAINKHG